MKRINELKDAFKDVSLDEDGEEDALLKLKAGKEVTDQATDLLIAAAKKIDEINILTEIEAVMTETAQAVGELYRADHKRTAMSEPQEWGASAQAHDYYRLSILLSRKFEKKLSQL